jgi:transposase
MGKPRKKKNQLNTLDWRAFQFAQYVVQGYSKKDAYKMIRPDVGDQTARDGGNRYMNNERVINYLQKHQQFMTQATGVTSAYLVTRLQEIIEDDEQSTPDKISAIKEAARISGITGGGNSGGNKGGGSGNGGAPNINIVLKEQTKNPETIQANGDHGHIIREPSRAEEGSDDGAT